MSKKKSYLLRTFLGLVLKPFNFKYLELYTFKKINSQLKERFKPKQIKFKFSYNPKEKCNARHKELKGWWRVDLKDYVVMYGHLQIK